MSPFWLNTLRVTVILTVLSLVCLSQYFWFAAGWRLAGCVERAPLRWLARVAWGMALLAVLACSALWMFADEPPRLWPGSWRTFALLGLWFSTALLAWLLVKAVHVLGWVWSRAALLRSRPGAADLPDASRRYFFQRAAMAAGAVPFVCAAYGFVAERLRFRVEGVEVPMAGLPAALDGLRIVQLSDIHIGSYMPREQVRRAVAMANELGGDLGVVTGDFVTLSSDPLGACAEELGALRAPLGVWGCLGNHEIYAGVEEYTTDLLRAAGIRILRRESAELAWRGQAFNLIGVDYQFSRLPGGRRVEMLRRVAPLVRRDVPNILLSHNPNAFPRAAELGIELTLAGHTHGGQVQVEILHRHINPARFLTDFVAGLFSRPMPAATAARVSGDAGAPRAAAFLYVNRGIGTIGAPVRIGSPPEITLLTLRRA
jgi:hypothetical protein